VTTDSRWQPFGIPPETWENDGHEQLTNRAPGPGGRSGTWLRCAMLALGLLAAAAAAVSFEAQYRMVYAAKGIRWAAGLEAAIPDAAALVFASLGIALALHGKRAIRARLLNVGAVATSVTMNLLAAEPGWRNLAIWVMPAIAYALASDTAIGVIRAWSIARQCELGEALAEDEATPLATLGRVALYSLRFVLAAPSTASGVRRQVLNMTPLPALPSAEPVVKQESVADLSPICIANGLLSICGNDLPCPSHGDTSRSDTAPDTPDPADSPEVDEPRVGGRHREPSGETKTSRFLQLVQDQHGPLAAIDLANVARIASDLAPEVDLHPGSARAALRPLVLAAQNGHSS
jgi:hypothetical protein